MLLQICESKWLRCVQVEHDDATMEEVSLRSQTPHSHRPGAFKRSLPVE